MSEKRYPEECKQEAIKQIVVQGYSVAGVASRLGVSSHSIYCWMKHTSQASPTEVCVYQGQPKPESTSIVPFARGTS